MSDETAMNTISNAQGMSGSTTPSGFLSSSIGRLVVIAVAAVVLVGVVGVVGYLVLGSNLMGGLTLPDPVVVTPPPAVSTPSAPTTGVPEVVPQVPVLDNRDVFSPRNPFKVIPPKTRVVAGAADTGGSTNTGSSSTSGDEGTLVLSDIRTVDGERKAVLDYSGQTYTLGANETLGTTSWKVLSVGTSSIVMLFGDERVTLTLGQGSSN